MVVKCLLLLLLRHQNRDYARAMQVGAGGGQPHPTPAAGGTLSQVFSVPGAWPPPLLPTPPPRQ